MRSATRRGKVAKALGLIAFTVLGGDLASAQENIERVFRDAREYTVRIRTQVETPFLGDQRGSFEGAGFLVDAARRWVVTNAHVVGQSPSTVQVAFVDGVYRPARKIYVDSFIDMAVLEVPDVGQRHPVAPISCSGVPEVGEGVGAFGHPLGIPFTGTRGIVSGKTDQDRADLLQIDATIDHGNSGGPVISLRKGRIVGIATAGMDGSKADRLNFATPMPDVCRILDLLKQGVAPEPPLMEFSLLVDEDNSHTLEVGCTYDAHRWPFEPGDRIVAVGEEGRKVTTLGSLVSALRGRTMVPIHIVRGGRETQVMAAPEPQPSVIDKRGVVIDGVLIAPVALEDSVALGQTAGLFVHSVEPGSAAEATNFEQLDAVQTVDGRSFADLASLIAHLERRPAGDPIRLVVRRVSDASSRWFDFHVRELPGENVRVVGSEPRLLTAEPGD